MANLAVGLYISTISQTQQQAMLSTFLFIIPSILFSGFVFPIYAMPTVFQYITLLNPMRYFMTVIRGIFLKGVGFTELWPDMAALAALGTVLTYLSIRRLSRRLE
jgi:ABC-2 type transport system permease protein